GPGAGRPRHVQVVARAQGERGTGLSRFASRARRHSEFSNICRSKGVQGSHIDFL
ncbi:MAG: hypothetical protein, partial [Olavius algarvensis Gamma 1 endosymbiont]